MPTPQKEQILRETSERIQGVQGVYLADLSGMTVEKVSLLRKKCREQHVQVRVVKNTLLKRALNQNGITALDEYLIGPTGLVFSPKDVSQLLSTFIAPMTQFLAAIDATLRLPATMADVLERERQKAS